MSERSANRSKATTEKFLSRLLTKEKENEDVLFKKLEKATRRLRFDENNAEDMKEMARTFEDDDDCKNPLIKEEIFDSSKRLENERRRYAESIVLRRKRQRDENTPPRRRGGC